MNSIDSGITAKVLSEIDYNRIDLCIKVSAFRHAYFDLLEAWEKAGHDIGCKDYPFDKSFDELGIENWLSSFQSELNTF